MQKPAPPPSASASQPPPPPPLTKDKSSSNSKIFWSAQAVFGSVVIFIAGYWYAARQNATLKNALGDVTLLPSVMGIKQQESNQPSYGTTKDYEDAIEALKKMIRRRGLSLEDRISTDADDLEEHGISSWSYHEERRPTVVVWAETTEEIQEIMLIARQYKVPITPYSGATSLEGHFSAVGRPLSSAKLPLLTIAAIWRYFIGHVEDGPDYSRVGSRWRRHCSSWGQMGGSQCAFGREEDSAILSAGSGTRCYDWGDGGDGM